MSDLSSIEILLVLIFVALCDIVWRLGKGLKRLDELHKELRNIRYNTEKPALKQF